MTKAQWMFVLAATLAGACSEGPTTAGGGDAGTDGASGADAAVDAGAADAAVDAGAADAGAATDAATGMDAAMPIAMGSGRWTMAADGGTLECVASMVMCNPSGPFGRFVMTAHSECGGINRYLSYQFPGGRPATSGTRTITSNVLTMDATQVLVNYTVTAVQHAGSGTLDVTVGAGGVRGSFTNVMFPSAGGPTQPQMISGELTCP